MIGRRRLPFPVALALVGLLALALRVAYALADADDAGINGDADWYHAMANQLADGHGFDNPFRIVAGELVPSGGDAAPTAFHPPAFPALLAVVSAVGLRSYAAHEIAGCVLGAGAVILVALTARMLAGHRAGLLAGLVAAIAAPLIGTEAVLMSESLFTFAVALALLAAVAVLRHPSAVNLAGLGIAIALAGLTRGEGLLLIVVLALPAALRTGAGGWRRFGIVALAAAVVIAPWTARNWSAFDRPVLVTTTDGAVITVSNNATTYELDAGKLGFIDPGPLGDVRPSGNEAVYAARLRRQGLDYAREHAGRLPLVVPARVLRTWQLWPPGRQVDVAQAFHGQTRGFGWLALAFSLALLGAGLAGYVLTRRRVPHVWVVLFPPAALVTIASTATYGDARFRIALDLGLCVLAGIGADHVARARRVT